MCYIWKHTIIDYMHSNNFDWDTQKSTRTDTSFVVSSKCKAVFTTLSLDDATLIEIDSQRTSPSGGAPCYKTSWMVSCDGSSKKDDESSVVVTTSGDSGNTQQDGVDTTPEKTSEVDPIQDVNSIDLLDSVSDAEINSRTVFEKFVDERTLVSHDAFGKKQMKIKVLEVSDEISASRWKFGDRVKVTKILVTIKHLTSQEVEEAEFDIESIERELAEKRHYTSTNRWIPTIDIKNGYVLGTRHTRLISDASALDYIMF